MKTRFVNCFQGSVLNSAGGQDHLRVSIWGAGHLGPGRRAGWPPAAGQRGQGGPSGLRAQRRHLQPPHRHRGAHY